MATNTTLKKNFIRTVATMYPNLGIAISDMTANGLNRSDRAEVMRGVFAWRTRRGMSF